MWEDRSSNYDGKRNRESAWEWVFGRCDLNSSQKSVLNGIAFYMPNSFASRKAMAKGAGMTVKTFNRNLSWLVEHGYVHIQKKGGGKKYLTDRYYINWSKSDLKAVADADLEDESDDPYVPTFKCQFDTSADLNDPSLGNELTQEEYQNDTQGKENLSLDIGLSGHEPDHDDALINNDNNQRNNQSNEHSSIAASRSDESSDGEYDSSSFNVDLIGLEKNSGFEESPFDAILSVCGMSRAEMTPSAVRGVHKVLKGLASACIGGLLSAEMIREKANFYALIYPAMTITPHAIEKHWPQLNECNIKMSKPSGGQLSSNFEDWEAEIN